VVGPLSDNIPLLSTLGDRRPSRHRWVRNGNEYVQAGTEPQRNTERRRLLPRARRSVSAVVHAPVPEQYLGANPNAVSERRPLYVRGGLEHIQLQTAAAHVHRNLQTFLIR